MNDFVKSLLSDPDATVTITMENGLSHGGKVVTFDDNWILLGGDNSRQVALQVACICSILK